MAPPAHRPLWKTAVALLLCVISVVHAAVSFTNDEYAIQAGKPFKLTWTGNKGPVTISLMNGPDADLQQVLVIASGYTGTSFTWTPPLTLPTDGYELEINDGVSTDYSARFQFQGSAGGGSAQPTTTTKQSPTSSTTPAATTTGTSPATVTETVTAPTTSTAGPGSSPQSTTAQSNSGDLSTGAKIGIGVGAGVGAILLVALLVLFIIRRRRRVEAAGAARIAANSAAPGDTAVTSPSYTFQSMSISSPASELEPKLERPWGEVGNPMNRAELWGGGRRMDATELDV